MANFHFPESWNVDRESETPESISYDINPTLLGKPTPRSDRWWAYMKEPWTPPRQQSQTSSALQTAQANGFGDDTQPEAEPISPQPLASPPRRGVAPNVEPPPNDPEFKSALQSWKGRRVYLPDGSLVPDPRSPTGYLMSPFDDLSDVAAAGRQTARDFWTRELTIPESAPGAAYDAFHSKVGQGGDFDYQRRQNKDEPTGFTQLPQFRNVSNFNVGLFSQQAGLPLEAALLVAGVYAARNSSNARSGEPYGLDPQTREFIERGYKAGRSGVFNGSGPPNYNR